MHASVIYPWDLDQHGAQQSSLWNKLPLSWQLGSRPHPRELLPARKPAASSRRMEGDGDKKSAQSVEEGASTKEERGGSRCRPCAFASSSQACCDELPLHKLRSQGAHRGPSSPVHTLHFGLPRSWSLVSGRCHQARLAKYDSPSGKEGLIVAYPSQKVWVTCSCLARELILTSGLLRPCTLLLVSSVNIRVLYSRVSAAHMHSEKLG